LLPSPSLIDRLPLSPTARGHLLALTSTASIASILIVSKWALESLDPATFGVWWYGTTVIVASLYQWARRRPSLWASFPSQGYWPIIFLGLISGLSTIVRYDTLTCRKHRCYTPRNPCSSPSSA